MFTVVLSEAAKTDIRQNTIWWSRHRSVEQAERWYVGIVETIYSLAQMPKRWPQAPEASKLKLDIRNALFGISSRPTHRILFEVDGETVNVFRVLHMSQTTIEDQDDLS